jgi:hypothetical protein
VIPDSSPHLRPNPIEFQPSYFDWPTWTRERIGSLDSIALARPASSPPCPQEISATVKAPVSPNLRQMVFSSSPARLPRSCGCAGQPQLYCLYCGQQLRRRGIVCVPVASAERRFWCSSQKFVACPWVAGLCGFHKWHFWSNSRSSAKISFRIRKSVLNHTENREATTQTYRETYRETYLHPCH